MKQFISPFTLGISGIAVVFGTSWFNHNRIANKYFRDPNIHFTLPESCETILIDDFDTCERLVLEKLLNPLKAILDSDDAHVHERLVLGLDCEWVSQSSHQVALLQITDGKVCLLVRLFMLESLPPSLIELLAHPKIIKCGVGIRQDVGLIWKGFGVQSEGVVELQPIGHHFGYTPQGASLKKLCNSVLNMHNIDKSHHVRCSNWEIEILSQRQITYAATDAWLSRQLFVQMYRNHSSDTSIHDFCINYQDKKPFWSKISSNVNSQVIKVKEFRASSRKGVMYENIKMLSPDGELLSFLSLKKANWYLSKKLADAESTDPLVIRLKFQPKAQSNDEFYLSDKKNMCVVCGKDADYMKHSIIPHSYRKLYDVRFKSRSSHDIVLLCRSCTRKVTVVNTKERERIAREYNAPIKGLGPQYIVNKEYVRVCGLASTLLNNSSLPEARINEIKKDLCEHLQKDELLQEDVETLANLETKQINPEHISHEQVVINTFQSNADFENFVFRWRNHFLETMQPQHLPANWRADRPLDVS